MQDFDNMENESLESPINIEEEVYETYLGIRSKKDKISFVYDVLNLGMEDALDVYYANEFNQEDVDAGTPLLSTTFVDIEYGAAHTVLFKNNILHISSDRRKIINLCVKFLVEQGHILLKYNGTKYRYKFNGLRYNKTFELVGLGPFISYN